MPPTFTLVFPCFNEEEVIEDVVRDAVRWFENEALHGEIIVVNDGSTDRSLEILDRLQKEYSSVRCIHFPKNRGYGVALQAGFDAAQSEVIAYMDSDGQFVLDDLSRFLREISIGSLSHRERARERGIKGNSPTPLLCSLPQGEKEAEVVVGVRTDRKDPFRRIVQSKVYNLLVRWILNVRVRDVNCAMKAFRASVWKQIRPLSAHGFSVDAEFFALLQEHNISWKEISIQHRRRMGGVPTGGSVLQIIWVIRELWTLRRSIKRRSAIRRITVGKLSTLRRVVMYPDRSVHVVSPANSLVDNEHNGVPTKKTTPFAVTDHR